MSVSYRPIPETLTATDSDTVGITDGCSGAYSTRTATASVTVSATDSYAYEPISVHKSREAPTDGSWSDIKSSDRIKMTPMKVVNRKVENFLAQVPLNAVDRQIIPHGNYKSLVNGTCKSCTVNQLVVADAIAEIDYIHQGDFNYWRSMYPDAPHFQLTTGFDESKVEAAKSSAYAELFQGYNLGEELYELRESIAMLRSLLFDGAKTIERFKKRFDRSAAKASSEAMANNWMQFRYGIMPIIYSISDIAELLEAKGRFRTVRKRVQPEKPFLPSFPDKSCFFYDQGSDSSVINVTTKAVWASELGKITDLININPVTTALAVYPWAMVVRWFFNINSWIDSQLKSSTSTALQFTGCVAVKTSYEVSTFFRMYQDSRVTVYYNGNSQPCGPGFYPSYGPFVSGRESSSDHLLRTITDDSYERYLYKPTDTRLVFNPHITWQRIVDGLILGSRPVSKLLRSL